MSLAIKTNKELDFSMLSFDDLMEIFHAEPVEMEFIAIEML